MALSGRICIVTGASRGIGRGIALQLGEAGATVYITGRTLKPKDGVTGSLEETAREVESRGGTCIPIKCDHSKNEDIQQLFERVKEEQNGRLDLLVNNAYAAVNVITKYWRIKFWEQPVSVWDDVNNVGLRNHYICTVYASQMMVKQGSGLIVWVSSMGGLRYLFHVAYGIGKAACDRMAADCGFELRKKNVACISLWPNLVKTENIDNFSKMSDHKDDKNFQRMKLKLQSGAESVEFTGKSVVHLLQDKSLMKKTGKILFTGDLADEYGFNDINGTRPHSGRSIAGLCEFLGYNRTAWILPRWLKIPKWVLCLTGSKF